MFTKNWNGTQNNTHVTVKQSRYRPRGFQEVKVPRFRDNGTGWWKVVSLMHRPPLPPGNIPGTHFLLEAESHVAVLSNNMFHLQRDK